MTIVLLSEKYFSLSSRMDLWLHLLQILGWLGILGTLIILANAVASWRAKERGIWSKLGDTLIFVSAIGFSWFAIYWNLLRGVCITRAGVRLRRTIRYAAVRTPERRAVLRRSAPKRFLEEDA